MGYDSGNGVMAAFDIADDGGLSPRWRRDHDHASHLLLLPGSGALVTGDHDRERMVEQVVVVDIATGAELVRTDRLVIGTDESFPPHEADPVGLLRAAAFDAAQIEQIGETNPRALFRLPG